MATSSAKPVFEEIDSVPVFEEIPDPVAAAPAFEEVDDELVQQEAMRNTMGAVQALDVMRAPQALDWSDVAEQADRERFQAAEQAGAYAALAEERGSGTGPGSEAFQWRRERDFQLGQISPNTSTGRMLSQQGQSELAQIEDVSTTEGRQTTPSDVVSGILGPGLSSTTQPVIESAARNVGPAIGGALGAAALTPTPVGAAARFVLPLAGGFLGAQVGGGVQEEILRTTETPEETVARQQRAAEDFERNPGLSRIGASVAQLPFFRPGLAQFGRAAAGDRGAIMNLGVAGVLGGGMEVAGAAIQGRTAEAEDIAAGIFSNLIMNEPTRLGRRLGFQPSTEEAAIEAAQKYRDLPLGSIPPEGAIPSDIDIAGVKFKEQPSEDPNRFILVAESPTGTKARFDYVRDADGVLRPTPGSGIEIFDPALRGKGIGGAVTKWVAENKGPVGSSGLSEEVTSPDALRMWKRLESEGAQIEPRSERATQDDLGESEAYVLRPKSITGEPNAQQISQTGTPDGGVRPSEITPENVPLPAPEGGEGVQPSGQGESLVEATPAAPREVVPVVEEVGRAVEPTAVEGPTGIRNAVVDENRRIAGLPPREQPLARSFPTIHEDARAVLAKDPEAGSRLVSELSQEIRPLTDAEDAVLTFEQNAREQARTEAVDAVNNAQTPEERDAAQQRLAEADNRLFEIYQVGQDAGTANARGLNARKLMQNRDFTLAKMLNEKRAIANDGEPLTPAQTEEVTKAYTRIAELEKQLADVESKSSARDAQMEYRRVLKETATEAKTAAKAKEAQSDFLTRMRESAKARIAARRGRLNVTIDPLNIAGLVDEAIVGATYVAEGVRDFSKWSAKMVSEFGDRVKPQLEALFQRAGTLADDMGKAYAAGAPETPEAVASRIKPGDKLEQKTVHDLYRAHVNAGVEDFDSATKAVTQDLQKTYPTITERQVHDALSGYGKISTPSKEADLVKLREFRNLARLTSQLEDAEKGVVPLKTGPQRDKATAKVRELQKRVNDAMRRNGLRQLAPDRQLASGLEASKTRIRNQIEDLQLKIRRGDYEVPPKREPAIDREKIDLQYQLAKEKEKWQEGVIEAKRARRSLGTKIWDSVKESANLSRAIVTSMDLPPVFRQGLFAIGRPVMAAKAVKDALLAIPSEKKAFQVQQEIENRRNAPLYSRSKLYLAKDTAQPLNRQEEAYMGNWFRKLPRWTVLGPALRASERTYNTFLNRIRADTFDAAVKTYSIADTDTATLKRVADIINTMTGRSTLPGKLEQTAVGLNTFLFAPRFMMSRFKTAVGEPLWTGNAKTRTFALEQYGRTLAGAALIYGLAKSAGLEVEEDPRSSNFAKIKIGNTMLDPLGGLSQVTTLLTRVLTGETKTQKGNLVPMRENLRPLSAMDDLFKTDVSAGGKPSRFAGTTADVMGRFLRTKLNPVAGQAVNIATGKDITGKDVTAGSVAKNLAVPISFQDILSTMEKQGVPRGTALYVLSLFGMGLQNRD